MTEHEIRFLGDVQRLELKPDDAVVITVAHSISVETAERIKAIVQGVLGKARKVLILEAGMTIGVLGP